MTPGGGTCADRPTNAVGGSTREVYPSGAEAVPSPPVLASRLPGPSGSPLTVRAQPEGTGARPPRCFCPRASHVVPDSDQRDPSRTLAVHRPFRARFARARGEAAWFSAAVGLEWANRLLRFAVGYFFNRRRNDHDRARGFAEHLVRRAANE